MYITDAIFTNMIKWMIDDAGCIEAARCQNGLTFDWSYSKWNFNSERQMPRFGKSNSYLC